MIRLEEGVLSLRLGRVDSAIARRGRAPTSYLHSRRDLSRPHHPPAYRTHPDAPSSQVVASFDLIEALLI